MKIKLDRIIIVIFIPGFQKRKLRYGQVTELNLLSSFILPAVQPRSETGQSDPRVYVCPEVLGNNAIA
jgi:hypothetical protein